MKSNIMEKCILIFYEKGECGFCVCLRIFNSFITSICERKSIIESVENSKANSYFSISNVERSVPITIMYDDGVDVTNMVW